MKRRFNAILKQDTGWWIGWIKEVPGVNSQGRTRAELLENLKSALTEVGDLSEAMDAPVHGQSGI
jgi:predicted RNase H-like HicB family nuclease